MPRILLLLCLLWIWLPLGCAPRIGRELHTETDWPGFLIPAHVPEQGKVTISSRHPAEQGEPGSKGDSAARTGIALEQGVIPSVETCGLDYRLYLPGQVAAQGLVVLGHGFMRRKEHLDDLAHALATAGMTAVSLDFCQTESGLRSSEQNGFAMVTLAQRLGTGPVVYVGFSAGALAALVAGDQDRQALGVIVLDPVDRGGISERLALGLDKPLIIFKGDPGPCNVQDYDQAALTGIAERGGRIERIRGASHCDFESPTDNLCQWFCGDSSPDESRRQAIIQAVVAAAWNLLKA